MLILLVKLPGKTYRTSEESIHINSSIITERRKLIRQYSKRMRERERKRERETERQRDRDRER